MRHILYDSTCIFLQISGCVNKCKHCYLPENISKFKTLKEIKEIIDNYAKVITVPPLTRNAYLYFHSEPTVHPELVNILEYMMNKGIKYVSSLSTNGFGIVNRKDGKEILSAFKKIGTKSLHLSLYGEKEYHDWFAGRDGAFDTIIKTSKIGKEMGYDIHWTLFLTKNNMHDLLKLEKQLKGEQIEIAIFGYSPRLIGKEEKMLHPTSKSLAQVKNLLTLCDRKTSVIKTEKEWVKMCIAKENMEPYIEEEEDKRNPWLIEYNWEIYDSVCMSSDFIVGDLRKDNLREIFLKKLHSKGSKKWRKLNYSSIAKQVGNSKNTQVYYFWDLLFRWFLKSHPAPPYKFSNKTKIKIEVP